MTELYLFHSPHIIIISGWGHTSFGGKLSSVLQEVGCRMFFFTYSFSWHAMKCIFDMGSVQYLSFISNWSEHPDTVWQVEVRVWKNQDCAKNYAEVTFTIILTIHIFVCVWVKATQTYGRMVLETMLCAAEKKKDACQGDSGGGWFSLKCHVHIQNIRASKLFEPWD